MAPSEPWFLSTSSLLPSLSSRVLRQTKNPSCRSFYVRIATIHLTLALVALPKAQETQKRGSVHALPFSQRPGMNSERGSEAEAREYVRFFVDESLNFARDAFAAPPGPGRFFAVWFGPRSPLVLSLEREDAINLMTELGVETCRILPGPVNRTTGLWEHLPILFASQEFEDLYRQISGSVVDRLIRSLQNENRKRLRIARRRGAAVDASSSLSLPTQFFNLLSSLLSYIWNDFINHPSHSFLWVIFIGTIKFIDPPTLAGWWTLPWLSMAIQLLFVPCYYLLGLCRFVDWIYESTTSPCFNCLAIKTSPWFNASPRWILLVPLMIAVWILPPYLLLNYSPICFQPLPSFFISLFLPGFHPAALIAFWCIRFIPYVGQILWGVLFWFSYAVSIIDERGRNCGCVSGEKSVERRERMRLDAEEAKVKRMKEKIQEAEKRLMDAVTGAFEDSRRSRSGGRRSRS